MDESIDLKASGDSEGKSLRNNLTAWREFIVVASKLMKWEQPYYPFVVFALISFKFLIIWYLDPSFITGVSMFVLTMIVLDYAVPFITPLLFSPANWNSAKEKEFAAACKGLAAVKKNTRDLIKYLQSLKHSNPWLYVAVLSVSLSTMAWLGNQMHNLMLLYFACLVVTALPGLIGHGCLDRVSEALKKFKGKGAKAN